MTLKIIASENLHLLKSFCLIELMGPQSKNAAVFAYEYSIRMQPNSIL